MAKNTLIHGYNANLQAFGQAGFDYATAGSTNPNVYIAVSVLEDAVITATCSEGDNLSSVSVPKGMTIYGTFSSITIVSGKALLYRKAQD